MTINDLPHVNASLNAITGVLITCGYVAIRARRITLHKTLMLTACACAVLFLASYITYHYHRTRVAGLGPTKFQGQGIVRPIYFTILISHTILAAVTLPMAAVTVVLGLRGRLAKHKRIARWTLPIWLYVSVTGVIVYFMLYHWFVAPGAG